MRKLLRDIVVPAGTLFYDAPSLTTRAPGHFEATIALGPNVTGDVTFFLEDYPGEVEPWFHDPKAKES